MKRANYIGMMSGTSMDGIDVVLCGIDETSCELLASYEHPFPVALKEEILTMTQCEVSLSKVGELDYKLGILFSEALETFLEEERIDSKIVTAVGSHGQTLWHQPEGIHPFTMQLGDPNIIAARTGMPVVADFRRKDMAYGGSGAPLAPAFHRFLFGKSDAQICIANIGGIANITVLGEELIGYDTGPGNMLMDGWIQKHKQICYDKNGTWARSGKVDYTLLDSMMEDAYFKQKYPKSTGREKFNEAWLDEMKGRHADLPRQDVQRTLLELSALSLSNEVLKFNPDMLLLCVGGAKNTFLIERIKALMPNVEVGIMQQGDWIEAMMMAWLAYKRIHKEPVALKEVTGAKENTILGGVYV